MKSLCDKLKINPDQLCCDEAIDDALRLVNINISEESEQYVLSAVVGTRVEKTKVWLATKKKNEPRKVPTPISQFLDKNSSFSATEMFGIGQLLRLTAVVQADAHSKMNKPVPNDKIPVLVVFNASKSRNASAMFLRVPANKELLRSSYTSSLRLLLPLKKYSDRAPDDRKGKMPVRVASSSSSTAVIATSSSERRTLTIDFVAPLEQDTESIEQQQEENNSFDEVMEELQSQQPSQPEQPQPQQQQQQPVQPQPQQRPLPVQPQPQQPNDQEKPKPSEAQGLYYSAVCSTEISSELRRFESFLDTWVNCKYC